MNFDIQKNELRIATDAAGLARLSAGLLNLISDAAKSDSPSTEGIHAGLELLRYMLPDELQFDMILKASQKEE